MTTAGLEITRTILKKALKLIRHPQKWCKGSYAQSVSGKDLGEKVYLAGDGCKFCAQGAIMSASVAYGQGYRHLANRAVRMQIPQQDMQFSLVDYNDDEATEHSDIVELFEGAIEDISLEMETAVSVSK